MRPWGYRLSWVLLRCLLVPLSQGLLRAQRAFLRLPRLTFLLDIRCASNKAPGAHLFSAPKGWRKHFEFNKRICVWFLRPPGRVSGGPLLCLRLFHGCFRRYSSRYFRRTVEGARPGGHGVFRPALRRRRGGAGASPGRADGAGNRRGTRAYSRPGSPFGFGRPPPALSGALRAFPRRASRSPPRGGRARPRAFQGGHGTGQQDAGGPPEPGGRGPVPVPGRVPGGRSRSLFPFQTGPGTAKKRSDLRRSLHSRCSRFWKRTYIHQPGTPRERERRPSPRPAPPQVAPRRPDVTRKRKRETPCTRGQATTGNGNSEEKPYGSGRRPGSRTAPIE